MLENKRKSIFFGFVILFVTLPSLQAKILWFNYYPNILYNPLTGSKFEQSAKVPLLQRPRAYNNRMEQGNRNDIRLLYNVIQHMNDRQQRQKHFDDGNIAKKCTLLFGSMYGTKQMRLRCLKNIRNTQNHRQTKNKFNNAINKQTFLDLTRAEDASTRTVYYTPDFSTDYIDFKDLRMNLEEDDMRKSNQKKNVSMLRTYSSSESDTGSIEVQKSSNLRNPKRFKVIDNGRTKNKHKKYDSDDSSSNDEYKKPSKSKKHKSHWDTDNSDDFSGNDYKKPATKEYYLQGNEDISAEEIEEPVVPKKYKSKKKKEYYLQGGRIIADDSGRRRLPHFMPKRFHWAEDEIHDLGYFWFNGPQGRYSQFKVRP